MISMLCLDSQGLRSCPAMLRESIPRESPREAQGKICRRNLRDNCKRSRGSLSECARALRRMSRIILREGCKATKRSLTPRAPRKISREILREGFKIT